MKKIIFSLALVFSALLINAQKCELRAIWIATAWGGIDWPTTKITKTGNATQIAAQKSELITILDNAQKGNLNTVFFQVRSHEDAMYKSSYEPWSHALSGRRGLDPGYDPLKFAIEEAHKRGLELHAWINPYRSDYEPRSSKVKSSWVLPAKILDPGNPEVQKFTMDVIGEIIDNYDIDGLVFDDYFYKKMTPNEYVSNETHQNTKNNPHNLSIDDWRRENVNKLIGMVMQYVEDNKPYLRFGVAPFGIYSTASRKIYDEAHKDHDYIEPAKGIVGQDAYSVLYCDAAAWLKRGYIDYISPQLYWPSLSTTPTYRTGQDYEVLCKWWYDLAKRYNRTLITSNDVANNGDGRRFNPPADIVNQIKVNRRDNKSLGTVFYNTTYYQNTNGKNKHFDKGLGYHTYLSKNLFSKKVLWPAITWRSGETTDYIISDVIFDAQQHSLSWKCNVEGVRFAIYNFSEKMSLDQGCIDDNLVGVAYGNEFNTTKYTDLYNNKWVICPVDRYGNLYIVENRVDIDNVEEENAYKIFDNGNGITIELDDAMHHISIYTATGSLVYNNTTSASLNISLPANIYIVRIDNTAQKIIVK